MVRPQGLFLNVVIEARLEETDTGSPRYIQTIREVHELSGDVTLLR